MNHASYTRYLCAALVLSLAGCGGDEAVDMAAVESLWRLLPHRSADAKVIAHEEESDPRVWIVHSSKPLAKPNEGPAGRPFPARAVLDVAAQLQTPVEYAAPLKRTDGQITEWDGPFGRIRMREVELEAGWLTVIERLDEG